MMNIDWTPSDEPYTEIEGSFYTEDRRTLLHVSEYVSEMVIPETVEEIKEGAFVQCALKTIVIPKSVKKIGEMAFALSTSLESVTILGPVERIEDGTFYNCDHLSEVHLPDTVYTIGEQAFHQCANLSEVHLPNTLNVIERSAFEYCTSLESIDIPDSVESIDGLAFGECTSLRAVLIPVTVHVHELAFFALDKCPITDVYVTSGKTNTAEGVSHYEYPPDASSLLKALDSCPLKRIHYLDDPQFYDSFRKACEEAFGSKVLVCSPEEVTYSKDMTTLIRIPPDYQGDYVAPDSITRVMTGAAKNCRSLETVMLPSVTDVGEGAFSGCSSLWSISLPHVSRLSSGIFKECASLRDVDAPEATVISPYAFYGCSELETLDTSSVKEVGEQAFQSCHNLTSVCLGPIERIGRSAFHSCDKLKPGHLHMAKGSHYSLDAFIGCEPFITRIKRDADKGNMKYKKWLEHNHIIKEKESWKPEKELSEGKP